jgi:hypothetical protein
VSNNEAGGRAGGQADALLHPVYNALIALAHQSLFRQCAGYRPFPLMTLHSNIDQHSGALALLLPLTELLPENYAQYRPLLADGLAFFLQRLSPVRQQAIVAAQIELPRSASRERRVISLFRLCPTLHKLGQVVAHDRRLSADLRQRLQELETLAPTDSLAAVRRCSIAKWVLSPVCSWGRRQSPRAASPWSCLSSGSRRQDAAPQRGVFKVLRPGVQERLEEELAIWPLLGTFLEERCAHHGLPVLDYANTLETVARLLANEVRLDQEQEHLRQAADFYAASPDILIPRLFPFCTPLVTAMERVDGCKVTHQDLPAAEMRQRAERVIRALLAQPFWGSGETGSDVSCRPARRQPLGDARWTSGDYRLGTHHTLDQGPVRSGRATRSGGSDAQRDAGVQGHRGARPGGRRSPRATRGRCSD